MDTYIYIYNILYIIYIYIYILVALEHGTHSNTGFLCSSNVFPRTLEHMFLLPSCRLEHAEHTFKHTNTPVQSQTPRTHSELSTRTRDQDIHISTSTAVLPKQLAFSNTVPNTTEHQPEHIFWTSDLLGATLDPDPSPFPNTCLHSLVPEGEFLMDLTNKSILTFGRSWHDFWEFPSG